MEAAWGIGFRLAAIGVISTASTGRGRRKISGSILVLALPPFRLQCLERLAQRRLGRDALAAVEIVAVDLEGADVVAALAVNAIAPQPDEVIAKLRHQSLHALRSSGSGEPAPRAQPQFANRYVVKLSRKKWLPGPDSNQRPSG